MPINPDIALQAGKTGAGPDLGAAMERGLRLQQLALQPALLQQQIAASEQQVAASKTGEALTRAQTAISEAQLPGTRAAAEQTRLALQKEQDLRRITAAHTRTETLPDGRMISVLDDKNLPAAFAAAGYAKEATDFIRDTAANQASSIKNAGDAMTFANSNFDRLMNTAREMEKVKPGSGTEFARQGLQAFTTIPGIGEVIKQDPRFSNLNITPETLTAYTQGTISPQQQIQNAQRDQDIAISRWQTSISDENSKQAGVTSQTGPQYRDPNSEVSKEAVKTAMANGIEGVQPGVTTAADLVNNPLFRSYQAGLVVPVNVKAEAATTATDLKLRAEVAGQIGGLVDRLVAEGKLDSNLKFRNAIEKAVRTRVLSDAEVRQLQGFLSTMEKDYPGLSAEDNLPALRGTMNQIISRYTRESDTYAAKARQQSFGAPVGAPGTGAAGAGAPIPAKPPTQERPKGATAAGIRITMDEVRQYAKETGRSAADIKRELEGRGVEIK